MTTNKIKTAVIYLHGLYIAGYPVSEHDKPKTLKQVNYIDEKQLTDHLKKLQSAYLGCSSVGPDRIRIQRIQVPSKLKPGKMRIVLDCTSAADWHHVAHIGLSLTNPLSHPIENLYDVNPNPQTAK